VTPWEIEAKLTLRRAVDARSIAALRQLGSHRLRVLSTLRLRTIYLDTPTSRLARHGIALRVRRTGSNWEATAKWGGSVDGAVHKRAELTVPLGAPPRFPLHLAPGPLATQLTAVLAGAPVSPIFNTEITRQRRLISPNGQPGAPVAELDIDCVTLRRPRSRDGAITYWEVEIELRDGQVRDLTRLVQLLRRHYALTPSVASKFARGMRLFHPRVVTAAEPQALSASDTVVTGARKVIARHLARVQRYDPAIRAGDDADAVHDMRVALRRLRAAVRAFKPALPAGQRAALAEELTWLTQVLGDVRDLDVQLAHLDKQDAPIGTKLDSLRRHLLAQRKRRRVMLKAALNAPRYLQLIAALDAIASASGGADSSKSAPRRARRVMRKEVRRLLKDGRRAMLDPTPERLHALRIAAKRVRYVLEFFKGISGRSGPRLTRMLVALQDTLGMQHDSIVAMETAREVLQRSVPAASRATAASVRAFATAQERNADRYRRRAQAMWKRGVPEVTKNLHAIVRHLKRLEGAGPSAPLE
jgi:triphosphatase